jgi:hypothetical protein
MKKLLIGLFVAILLAIAAAFFLFGNINSIVEKAIETAGPELLGVPVTTGSVNISLLSGSGEIRELKIGNPEGYEGDYAFSLDRVLIEVEPMSFATDKIHVKSIVIDSPSIAYEGDFKKSNLQQLQENIESKISGSGPEMNQGSDAAPAQDATKLQIDHFSLSNANVLISLTFLSGEPLVATIPTIELNDFGKVEDKTAADAVKEILVELTRALIPVIQQNTDKFGEQIMLKGKETEGKLKESFKKFKSLFDK